MTRRWIEAFVAWMDEARFRACREPEGAERVRDLSTREWVAAAGNEWELVDGAETLAHVWPRPDLCHGGRVDAWSWVLVTTYETKGDRHGLRDTPEDARRAVEQAMRKAER